MLKLSKDLSLPLDAVTQTFGVLAVRGAGKSNLAAVMAEQMFLNKLPFVVIDPVGAWWGLRSSSDGKGPGLAVPVFGGRHGDVPLEKTGGVVIADLVVDDRLSCVLDCSEFSENDKTKFLLDFAVRLYRRNQDPLHLFLEEADDYAPQRPFREQAHLLRAWENIVRRGRARGLGITMVTQRSAALNKNVLTQIETLCVLRTTAPNDRKAIEAWVEYHGQGKELLASLPELAAGEAWVWSPSWLKTLRRVQIDRRSTFDSGATPKDLKGRRPPASLADVDLAGITKKMQATIERAKAEDPRELRQRIRDLEQQLKKQSAGGDPAEVKLWQDRAAQEARQHLQHVESIEKKARGIHTKLTTLAGELAAIASNGAVQAGPPVARFPSSNERPKPAAREGRAVLDPTMSSELGTVEVRILRAIEALNRRRLRVDITSVARWLGLHPHGGHFRGAIRALRDRGYLRDFSFTETTPAVEPICADGAEPILGLLPSETHRNVLSSILEQPAADIEELAGRLGLHPHGGHFRGAVRWLRQMAVIPESGKIQVLEGVY